MLYPVTRPMGLGVGTFDDMSLSQTEYPMHVVGPCARHIGTSVSQSGIPANLWALCLTAFSIFCIVSGSSTGLNVSYCTLCCEGGAAQALLA